MLAAGVALSVGAVGVANQALDSSPESVRATTDVVTNEPTSALVDGPGFAAVIDQAIAGIEVPQSVLLDQAGFQAAVDQAVAGIEVPQSVLLDGSGFGGAVDQAVAAVEG